MYYLNKWLYVVSMISFSSLFCFIYFWNSIFCIFFVTLTVNRKNNMRAIVNKVTLSTNKSTGLTTTDQSQALKWWHFYPGSNAVYSRVLEGTVWNFGEWKVEKNETYLYLRTTIHGNHLGMANLSLAWFVSMCVSQSYLWVESK